MLGAPEDVARHIAQRAAAEIVEAAPVERLIEVAAERSGSLRRPDVYGRGCAAPSHRSQSSVSGTRRRRRNLGEALRPDRPVGPGVDFGDVADLAGPDHLRALAGAFVRVALVAHLRRDLILGGRLGEHARFPDGARQRLLHVDVLAALHAAHGARRRACGPGW